MSRIVRRQLFEMMDTLQTATNMLEGLFAYDSGEVSYEELVELLADCQNCAITVGKKIEAVYGEGTKSVAMLEAYCESIYELSQSLEQTGESVQHYNNAKEHLQAVISAMEQEIPDKKEILFLPYKASMWDSLESVYLSAREDENCEAYVVPIPYFDRKPDKSLGQMHYEGAEYPANIPVTNWQQYSIEERCPDVIYIHNAYDDMNLVTCVHPKFFSSNLKNYTDELIYIPYFVLEEIEPDDQLKIESMKHFCVLPGIINADKVILQSEKMSQIYINEYAKAFESAGATVDREQLKQKFLGLGSPKFDKVVNTKKEDVEIPAEWLKIIQKPDGTWKKIIFYNTSVTALLKHEEKMLTKMKDVFEVFKERQDEMALLWRPHPLIRTTIEAMRPQLWQEYEQIVEQYKSEGWGIYDDTTDMDRAIALSDGYYGDRSSVIQLCQKAGVPVLVQDVNLVDKELIQLNEKRELGIEIADVACDADEIWFCAERYNRIYYINRDDLKLRFWGEFPEGMYNGWRTYGMVKKVGDNIYFFPFHGTVIAVLDIKRNTFRKIELDKEKLGCESGHAMFAGVVQYKSYLFGLPKYSGAIICIDTGNYELKYITGWAEQVGAITDNKHGYFRRQYVIKEGKAYCPFYHVNAILELDCDNLRSRVYRLDGDGGYSGICQVKEGFCMTHNTGDLIIWTPDKGCVSRIDMRWEKGKTTLHAFLGPLYYNDKLHLFPGQKTENEMLNMGNDICVEDGVFSLIKEDEDNWIYYRYDLGILTYIDKMQKVKKEVEIKGDSKEILGLILKEQKNIISESRQINVHHLYEMMSVEK